MPQGPSASRAEELGHHRLDVALLPVDRVVALERLGQLAFDTEHQAIALDEHLDVRGAAAVRDLYALQTAEGVRKDAC